MARKLWSLPNISGSLELSMKVRFWLISPLCIFLGFRANVLLLANSKKIEILITIRLEHLSRRIVLWCRHLPRHKILYFQYFFFKMKAIERNNQIFISKSKEEHRREWLYKKWVWSDQQNWIYNNVEFVYFMIFLPN